MIADGRERGGHVDRVLGHQQQRGPRAGQERHRLHAPGNVYISENTTVLISARHHADAARRGPPAISSPVWHGDDQITRLRANVVPPASRRTHGPA